MNSEEVIAELRKRVKRQNIDALAKFFKTEKGGYGEGDQFIGVMVPDSRCVAKQYQSLPLCEIEKLLASPIHEARLTGLFILVLQYQRGDLLIKEQVFQCYLRNLNAVNNWDLVDSSADLILGAYLIDKDRRLLYELAGSDNLWERRIAMVSTHYFIKNHQFDTPLEVAEILLNDLHHLIHKAVGWMLREIGNRDEQILLKFLDRWAATMPRTALRYAIERLEPAVRQHYLAMKSRKS